MSFTIQFVYFSGLEYFDLRIRTHT